MNGARAHLPLSLHHRALLLSQAGSHLLLVTDFGLRVSYDWHHHLRLHIPSTFSAHLCGLCGNYNGDPADDLPDAPTLAQSWPLGDSNQLCWHDCFGTCGSCTQKQSLAYAGEAWCGLMAKAGEGPFSPCHARVNPEVYAYNCMADLCHHNGYREVLCEALAAYATACQLLGVSIGDWRELARCCEYLRQRIGRRGPETPSLGAQTPGFCWKAVGFWGGAGRGCNSRGWKLGHLGGK